MKVNSRKDTISGFKKIKLIEGLSLSTSYDIAKDSLNWAPLSINAYTTLFKKLTVKYNSSWSPYVRRAGEKINKFVWDETNKKTLFHRDNHSWQFGLNYNLSSKKGKEKPKKESTFGNEDELADINQNIDDYVDFTNPWSLNFSYTLRYTNTFNDLEKGNYEKTVVQTLSFSGDVNVTKKWKVGFRSGYDFENKDFSYTSIDFYRDLHCWELHLNWIPTGFRKSYNLTIRVKSTVLQDLKLTKKKDWRDY